MEAPTTPARVFRFGIFELDAHSRELRRHGLKVRLPDQAFQVLQLLLARPGYPIDHRKVIDACAANGVVMELNANPQRMDIDYSWLPYCQEKGVMVSINPDAHSRTQVGYVKYGVMSARKGALKKENCLNAMGLQAFQQWINKKGQTGKRENRGTEKL